MDPIFYRCSNDMTHDFPSVLSIILFLEYNLCLGLCDTKRSHPYKSMMILSTVPASGLSKVGTIPRNHLRITLSSQGTLSHSSKVTLSKSLMAEQGRTRESKVSPPSPTKYQAVTTSHSLVPLLLKLPV